MAQLWISNLKREHMRDIFYIFLFNTLCAVNLPRDEKQTNKQTNLYRVKVYGCSCIINIRPFSFVTKDIYVYNLTIKLRFVLYTITFAGIFRVALFWDT